MEKTMFLLGKVHSVFDFAPPIPLVPEIRILNKALSYHYNFTNTNVEDAKKTTERVIQTVNKFSYILPEIDLLLNRMESTNLDIDKQELKKEIIASLEKVIDEKEDKQESIKNNNENK
jgi:vacuolar-type H+-ATPase subunit I/STV1